jgi:hypothetical protein
MNLCTDMCILVFVQTHFTPSLSTQLLTGEGDSGCTGKSYLYRRKHSSPGLSGKASKCSCLGQRPLLPSKPTLAYTYQANSDHLCLTATIFPSPHSLGLPFPPWREKTGQWPPSNSFTGQVHEHPLWAKLNSMHQDSALNKTDTSPASVELSVLHWVTDLLSYSVQQ